MQESTCIGKNNQAMMLIRTVLARKIPYNAETVPIINSGGQRIAGLWTGGLDLVDWTSGLTRYARHQGVVTH